MFKKTGNGQTAGKIGLFGVLAIIIILTFSYVMQKPPKQRVIEKNAYEFVLDNKEVHHVIKVKDNYPVSTLRLSKISGNPPADFRNWGFKEGFGTRYEDEKRGFDLMILRFSTIDGADTAFGSLIDSLNHRMGEPRISQIGRESRAFRDKENMNSVIFREANLLGLIRGGIKANEIEMYTELVEDKIHFVLEGKSGI